MKKILIIENDKSLLSLLKEVLELNDNYDVVIASTGLHGIELIKSFNPDIIICDLHLPDISGYEIYKKVNINFLFLTALSHQEWRHQNNSYHLQKPVSIESLTAEIERILNNS